MAYTASSELLRGQQTEEKEQSRNREGGEMPSARRRCQASMLRVADEVSTL